LRISRSPVNAALDRLHAQGIVAREPNRGYFVARALATPNRTLTRKPWLDNVDVPTAAYFRIAEERLQGKLPDEFSETMLKTRYRLTAGQLNEVLTRIANEGWAEKKPGYGWIFSMMLTTPDSLEQSYRLRLALEPAALLEPGYRLDPLAIERCRKAERHLLEGGIETDTADQLHERGVRFHETIVEGSGNPFFIDTVRRINRVRRLLAYRSMADRSRYEQHCRQHLRILELLERQCNDEAAEALRAHLQSTLRNFAKIRGILRARKTGQKRASSKPSDA
ncbi:MAG: GntR family transcriptional regulator, partial [Betaproteobacteria bacterium]